MFVERAENRNVNYEVSAEPPMTEESGKPSTASRGLR